MSIDTAVSNFKNAMRACEPSLTRFVISTIFPRDNNEDSERWLNMFVMRNRRLLLNPKLSNGVLTVFVENPDLFYDRFADFNSQCNCIYSCRG